VRTARGIPRLEPLRELDQAADEQASYMALLMRAGHNSLIPSRRTVVDRVRNTGIYGSRIAENVLMESAYGPNSPAKGAPTYQSLAAFLVGCWMNSPGHRANLLDPGFTYLGCGARISHGVRDEEIVFASQVFVLRASEPSPPG
jgi:uncharacterized protein YkwD